jgi:hypothetical protein
LVAASLTDGRVAAFEPGLEVAVAGVPRAANTRVQLAMELPPESECQEAVALNAALVVLGRSDRLRPAWFDSFACAAR